VLQYARGVAHHIVVPKAHDHHTQLCQGSGTPLIPLDAVQMLAAIQFNAEAQVLAVEVENVPAKRMLSPEILAQELPTAQMAPQACFGWRFPSP